MEALYSSYNVAPNPHDAPLGLVPIGTVLPFAGLVSPAPFGFLYCDGSAISRTTYGTLFNVIGTTFGAGNGTTTFNLPNTGGRVVRGVGLAPYTLGAIGGSDSITLVPTDIPDHAHTISDPEHTHTASDSGHTHTCATQGLGYFAQTGSDGNRADAGSTGTGFANITVDKAFTGITITDSLLDGGVQVTQTPTNIVNTFLTLNYIIKAQ